MQYNKQQQLATSANVDYLLAIVGSQ